MLAISISAMVASRGVELAEPKHGKLLFDGEIDQTIFDTLGVFTRPPTRTLEKLRARVAGHDPSAEEREAPGELAVATCDVEHALAPLQFQHLLQRRSNQ